jgi:small-conductance mechanosensitive channel
MRRGFEALRHTLINDPMQLVMPLITLAMTFLVAWVVRRLVLRALTAWSARTQSRAGTISYEALRGPSFLWTVILAVQVALQSSNLPARYTARGSDALLVLWIFSLTLMSMRLAGSMVRFYGGQIPGAMPVTTLTQSLAQIVVLILGVLILLAHFEVHITPILTALGVGGLAVALALQDTLSNLFGGVYVAMAGQVRLGDYIKLNSGEEGYVSDIGWRSTTIRVPANNMIIVPNAKLAQAIVTNYYLPEKRMASSLQVGVGYDTDLDRVEQVLLAIGQQAAHEIPGMLAEPEPNVAFEPGFGDSSLGFTLNYHVAEFNNQPAVRNELRRRVLRRFRQEGIEIPFPTRTVYFGPRMNTNEHE